MQEADMNNDDNIIDKENQRIKNHLIANGLQQVRKAKGYSLEETAQYLRISITDLLLYEAGEKEIDCSLLSALSKHYNVGINEFFVCLQNI